MSGAPLNWNLLGREKVTWLLEMAEEQEGATAVEDYGEVDLYIICTKSNDIRLMKLEYRPLLHITHHWLNSDLNENFHSFF